jgi:neurofibromin 1
MANDITILTSVQSLRQLATLRLSTVVNSLAGALEGLAKVSVASRVVKLADIQYSISKSHADVPLEVHQSQGYLLYLLDSCLTVTWRQRAEATPSQSSDIPHFWSDPLPLDESSARTLLNVLITYLRFVSSENSLHSGTASPAPSRDGRGQSSSIVSWGHGVVTQHPGFSALSPSFLRTHQHTHNPSNREDELLSCTNMSNITNTVTQTTRYLGQIIFYLSSSNWNLVFTRIRSRLSHLTTTIEDTPDLTELRLLQWANLDRVRLGQLMQETSNVFIHIKRPSQIAFASVLHSAIWNWIDCNPDGFDSLVGSERRIDGNPEGLFDVLYSMSDFSSTNAKRTAVFYPLLAMILVICPDLFKKVVNGDSAGKSSGLSKKVSFMESLKKGLSGHKGFEPSAACYVDFIKASMRVSPRHSNSALRSLLPQVLHDLKVSLQVNETMLMIRTPSFSDLTQTIWLILDYQWTD